jgi:hypothetical protein
MSGRGRRAHQGPDRQLSCPCFHGVVASDDGRTAPPSFRLHLDLGMRRPVARNLERSETRMIRRENRAKVEFGTVGVFNKTQVIWVSLPMGRQAWTARLDGDVTTSQSTTPALVWGARGNARGRDYWLFHGALYSSDVPLDPYGVRALIIEGMLKERRGSPEQRRRWSAPPSPWLHVGRRYRQISSQKSGDGTGGGASTAGRTGIWSSTTSFPSPWVERIRCATCSFSASAATPRRAETSYRAASASVAPARTATGR